MYYPNLGCEKRWFEDFQDVEDASLVLMVMKFNILV